VSGPLSTLRERIQVECGVTEGEGDSICVLSKADSNPNHEAKMVRYALTRGTMALCLYFLFISICVAKDVGVIISYKAGVVAQRNDKTVDLAMKAIVNDKDILKTDETGRAQILFNDETSVSLGSNTLLKLEDVIDDNANSAFRARIDHGIVRFITGKIVEKNPNGFSVVTPDATVGIRGTIFAVRVGNGTTTVFVTNTTKQVFVNGVLIPSGFKIVLPQGTIAPITSDDNDLIASSTSARTAQASPVNLSLPTYPAESGSFPPTALAQIPLIDVRGIKGVERHVPTNYSPLEAQLPAIAGTSASLASVVGDTTNNVVINSSNAGALSTGSGALSGTSVNSSNSSVLSAGSTTTTPSVNTALSSNNSTSLNVSVSSNPLPTVTPTNPVATVGSELSTNREYEMFSPLTRVPAK